MSKKLKQMLAAYGLVLPSFLTVMLVVAWPILTAIKTSFTDRTPAVLPSITTNTFLKHRVN